MRRFKLLDLFCKAGGCAVVAHRAGFDVVGVDHEPQPRYPFGFHLADALEFAREHGHEFDAIHASPPCQRFSRMRNVHPHKNYPDLIEPTRAALIASGLPYVIENVPGAPLINPVKLRGTMFGLRVFRERHFESNVLLLAPTMHPNRKFGRAAPQGRPATPERQYIVVTGHFYGGDGYAARAMGIDWMTRAELSQAIPPAYTECIGIQLLMHVQHRAEVNTWQ